MKNLSVIIQENLDLDTMCWEHWEHCRTGAHAEGCRSSGDAPICLRVCVLNNDVLHMGLKDVMCRTECLYSSQIFSL